MFFLPRIRAWVSVVYEHTPSHMTPNTCPHNPACNHFRYGTTDSMCGYLGDIVLRPHRIHLLSSVSVMYFDHLLFVFLYAFLVRCESVSRRVKVYRLPSGIDKFEVLDDNTNSICTEIERAKEFCAKHEAINVQNTGSCSSQEETLQCRCNSTKSTFLLHEGRCVNNHNITRLLHGGISSGRRSA